MFHEFINAPKRETIGSILFGNTLMREKYERFLHKMCINRIIYAIAYDRVIKVWFCKKNSVHLHLGKQGWMAFSPMNLSESQTILSVIQVCECEHANRILHNQFTTKSCEEFVEGAA